MKLAILLVLFAAACSASLSDKESSAPSSTRSTDTTLTEKSTIQTDACCSKTNSDSLIGNEYEIIALFNTPLKFRVIPKRVSITDEALSGNSSTTVLQCPLAKLLSQSHNESTTEPQKKPSSKCQKSTGDNCKKKRTITELPKKPLKLKKHRKKENKIGRPPQKVEKVTEPVPPNPCAATTRKGPIKLIKGNRSSQLEKRVSNSGNTQKRTKRKLVASKELSGKGKPLASNSHKASTKVKSTNIRKPALKVIKKRPKFKQSQNKLPAKRSKTKSASIDKGHRLTNKTQLHTSPKAKLPKQSITASKVKNKTSTVKKSDNEKSRKVKTAPKIEQTKASLSKKTGKRNADVIKKSDGSSTLKKHSHSTKNQNPTEKFFYWKTDKNRPLRNVEEMKRLSIKGNAKNSPKPGASQVRQSSSNVNKRRPRVNTSPKPSQSLGTTSSKRKQSSDKKAGKRKVKTDGVTVEKAKNKETKTQATASASSSKPKSITRPRPKIQPSMTRAKNVVPTKKAKAGNNTNRSL